MKYLIFILALFVSLDTIGQNGFNEQFLGTKDNTIRVRNRLAVDSGLALPRDTLNSAKVNDFAAVGGYLYLKTATGWKQAIDSVNSKIFHVAYNPAGLTKQVGQSATFGVVASGGKPPYKYQWQKSTTNRTGDTLASMVILTTALSDTGNYRVRVTDSLGVIVFSQYANLSIISANGVLTGQVSADSVNDGTTKKAFLATERTKLAGIATGATANSTDAQLRDRTNHTGSQAESTITNLVADLAAKAPIADPVFTGTPKIGADTVATRAYARAVGGGGGGGGSAILYGTTGGNTDGAMTQGATTTALALKQDASTAATLTGTQTLTNKTLTAPAITSPTGLVKGDVGLGSVDNTSDATKNSATATLTGKTMSGASNTFTNLPESAVTNLVSDLAAKTSTSQVSAIVHDSLGDAKTIRNAKTAGQDTLVRLSGSTFIVKTIGFSDGPGYSWIRNINDTSAGYMLVLTGPLAPSAKHYDVTSNTYTVLLANGPKQYIDWHGSANGTITLPTGSSSYGLEIHLSNTSSFTIAFNVSVKQGSTTTTAGTAAITSQGGADLVLSQETGNWTISTFR